MKYKPPDHIWVLFDRSNGDACYNDGGHNYTFWFFSKRRAVQFKQDHEARRKAGEPLSHLIGPYKYERG